MENTQIYTKILYWKSKPGKTINIFSLYKFCRVLQYNIHIAAYEPQIEPQIHNQN